MIWGVLIVDMNDGLRLLSDCISATTTNLLMIPYVVAAAAAPAAAAAAVTIRIVGYSIFPEHDSCRELVVRLAIRIVDLDSCPPSRQSKYLHWTDIFLRGATELCRHSQIHKYKYILRKSRL